MIPTFNVFIKLFFLMFLFLGQLLFAKTDLATRIPYDETYSLKDGTKIALPLKIHSQDYVLLNGVGEITAINSLLAPEDLEAIPLQDNPSLSGVGVYMIHYNKTEIPNSHDGAYNEMVILFLVKSKKEASVKGTQIAVPEKMGGFVAGIRVDEEMALNYGIEVWGFPKILTKIVPTITEKNFEFTVMKKKYGEKKEIYAFCNNCMALERTEAPDNPFVVVTPYQVRRSWFKAINAGPKTNKNFDPANDKFEFDKKGSLGLILNKVKFQPAVWEIGKDVQAVFYK